MTGWLPDGVGEWRGRTVARTVAAPRRRAALVGTVRSVEVHHANGDRPRGVSMRPGVAFDACVEDGTGTIVVRWMGRDRLPGVGPGASLCVGGTVADVRGRPVVLNPLYRFVPARQDGSSVS